MKQDGAAGLRHKSLTGVETILAIGTLLALIFVNLYLNNDQTNWRGISGEIDAIGIAVSEMITGESGFVGHNEVKLILDRSPDDLNKGLTTVVATPPGELGPRGVLIADGNSPAYVAFAKWSFRLFGPKIVSLYFGFALIFSLQIILLCLSVRKEDGDVRLGAAVLLLSFFLVFCAPDAPIFLYEQSRRVYVMRFFESLAMIPLLHAMYVIWETRLNSLTVVQTAALGTQMAMLFLACVIRGSAIIGVIFLLLFFAIVVFLKMRQGERLRTRALLIQFLLLAGSLILVFESLTMVSLLHGIHAIWESRFSSLSVGEIAALGMQMAPVLLARIILGSTTIAVAFLLLLFFGTVLLRARRGERLWTRNLPIQFLLLTGSLVVVSIAQFLLRLDFIIAGLCFALISAPLVVKGLQPWLTTQVSSESLKTTGLVIAFSLIGNSIFFTNNLDPKYFLTRSTIYSTDAFWHRAVIGLGYHPGFLETQTAAGVSCEGLHSGHLVAGVADSNGHCIYLSEVKKRNPAITSMPWNDLYTEKYEHQLREFFVAYAMENPGVFLQTTWLKTRNVFGYYLPHAFSQYLKAETYKSTPFLLSALAAIATTIVVALRTSLNWRRLVAMATGVSLLALAFVLPSQVAWPAVFSVINLTWGTCFVIIMLLVALSVVIWTRLHERC